jgi:hypothetical protein
MRKITTMLIALLFLFNAFAQEEETEMVKEVRAFYDALDHSAMKTDYLFNRGFVILNNLEEWKDGLPIITNLTKWQYVFESIQKSNLNNTKNLFKGKDLEINNNIEKYGISTVALSILNFEGDYITNDNVKEYIEKKRIITYKPLKIFAGTVLHQNICNGTVRFSWDTNLYFTNIQNRSYRLFIDFANKEGFYEIDLTKKQIIEVRFDCIGEKSICFKLIDKNDTLVSYSKINIKTLERERPTKSCEIISQDTSTQPLLKSANSDPNVNLSYGSYDYYEGVDNVLDKPIIIAEGFDMAGTMSSEDLYNYWSSRISILRQRGYDVFVLNFNSPVRSLQDNSQVVIDLIKGINQQKAGKFEGIYIGESMGGIIGRIALKRMENEGYDHQIGLFVPYDAPFKGANIPMGIQWVLQDMSTSFGLSLLAGTFLVDLFEILFDTDVPIVDIYSQLNSTAARQLLARHYTGSSVYNTFQSYLSGLGYPLQSRNVAIVNGSNNGTYQLSATPGAEIFSETILIGLVWDASVKAWYDHENEVKKVSRVFYFSILTPLLTTYVERYEPFDNKPYVNGPGSYVGTDYNSIQFTFVPTLSAIDINNSIYNTGNFGYFNQNENAIIANGLTPLDDIFINGTNSGHTFYEGDFYYNQDFNNREIMYSNMYLQKRNIINNRDFEAANTITVGNNTQPWGTLKHQATGDFIINSGKTVNMVAGQSVKLAAGFKMQTGAAFKASVDPTDPTLKSSLIEELTPPIIVGNKYANNDENYSFKKLTDKENVKWLLLGNNYEYSSTENNFTLPDNLNSGQFTLICSVNLNGQEVSSSKVIVVNKPAKNDIVNENLIENGTLKFTIYPNPATNLVNIELNNAELLNVEIQIKNITGKTAIRKNHIQFKNVDIDISSLQKGIYFIELLSNNHVVSTRKLIKQ